MDQVDAVSSQQNGLFDHLVRASKQWFGDREAEHFGGLEVDDQFDLC